MKTLFRNPFVPVGSHPTIGNESKQTRDSPANTRRARHGRPPSRWLRSLNADEIRIWLATIEVPEAGVSGMTFWEHLTRDHSFDAEKIEGLTIDEQAKLHAAAHHRLLRARFPPSNRNPLRERGSESMAVFLAHAARSDV